MGDAACRNCGKFVERYYQTPNRLSDGEFDVEGIPMGKTGLVNKLHRIAEERYVMNFWLQSWVFR